MMTIARSRLTAQGQISVPSEVWRKLGIGPGSVIEWEAEGRKVLVRRAARYTSQEIHHLLFPKGSPQAVRSLNELKQGIRKYLRERHARH